MTYSFTASGSKIFAGTAGSGVYVSVDNGSNWVPMSTGLTNKVVYSIATIGDNVLVGTSGDGVFASVDNGANWSQSSTGLASIQITSFAKNNVKLFASIYGRGVYLSADNGANWTAANSGLTDNYVYSLAINGTNLYAGTWGGGVFLSTDNGSTWIAVNNGLTNLYIRHMEVKEAYFFAATDNGVFSSTDNGTSWEAAGLSGHVIHSLASSGINLFAATNGGGVYRSTDNGSNWTPVNTGLTYAFVSSLLVSDHTIFAGTFGGGIFSSTNNGESWTAINEGLLNKNINSLAIRGSNLFAGTTSGVFVTSDHGLNWFSNGLANQDIRSFGVSENDFFAGTYGQGVFSRPFLTIKSFSPSIGTIGTSVKIIGTNFSVTPSNNSVDFKGIAATVTEGVSTSLTTSVPEGAMSGKITVRVEGEVATSLDNFTVDSTPPIISIYSPIDNLTGVSLSSNLVITFNEDIQKGTGNIIIKERGVTKQTIAVTSARVTISDSIVTIDLADFTYGDVNIEIEAGCFKDLAGNNYAGIKDATTWNFTVGVITGLRGADESFINLKAYPNPTSGLIRVEMEGTSNSGTLEVYDLLGFKLQAETLSSGYTGLVGEIELTNCSSGIYILFIKTEVGEKSLRIERK